MFIYSGLICKHFSVTSQSVYSLCIRRKCTAPDLSFRGRFEDSYGQSLALHYAVKRLKLQFGPNGISLIFIPRYNPSASHGLCLKFADLVLHCSYQALCI